MALWGAAGLAARARARRAEAEAPPLGRILDVAGARIHAWEAGEGPAVVLLHGASGNLRDFTFDLAPRLARRFRVIAFDRPGLGHSGRLPGYGPHSLAGESPPEQARTLAAAARSLGAERPIVLGHSYGGAVALAWALEAEAAGLVLLGAVSNPWPGGLGLAYHLPASRLGALLAVPPISAALPRGRLEGMVARTFAPDPAPPGYAAHLGAGLALRPQALVANARQVTSLYPHVVAMAQRYSAEIACPVEILHGAEDRTVPPEIHSRPLAEQIAGARLTLLPGIGHMPHHAAPRRAEAAALRVARAAGLRPALRAPIVSQPIRRAPDPKAERP
jgi:pimeloyl-ACP methyl ester carboxylesterase